MFCCLIMFSNKYLTFREFSVQPAGSNPAPTDASFSHPASAAAGSNLASAAAGSNLASATGTAAIPHCAELVDDVQGSRDRLLDAAMFFLNFVGREIDLLCCIVLLNCVWLHVSDFLFCIFVNSLLALGNN